jgi:acyl-CoA synthetase (AMP-forming)/AMP-acid ligase II
VNDEVVHGIPTNRVLEEGQIVGIDCGAEKKGYYGDHAKTFAVGKISDEKRKLMEITQESLRKGIAQAFPGNYVSDIGYAIQSYVEAFGYSVVRELVGHGIGTKLHEEPQIPNYGEPKQGYKLREGMCIAIEPMINQGVKEVKTDNNQKAYKDTIKNGWMQTGDAGFFDEDGHLKIIDRAKDVGRMSDGTMFAPKYIENKLKFFPFIKEAVAFGDEKEFTTAFICIDIEAVGNWAERKNLAYSGYTDLSARAEVYDLLQECVETVNADLARDEKLSGSQIKRFLLLHKELDADDGELTRTRKVRRRIVAEKYAVLISALDDPQQTHCEIDSQMTFEDGRTGMVHADLQIRESALAESQVHTLAA